MGGHSSKGMTFREPAAIIPPPVPILHVENAGYETLNGDYLKSGEYGGVDLWVGDEGYIWYDDNNGEYFLSEELGSTNYPAYVQRIATEPPDPIGLYVPYNDEEGTPLITRV